MIFYTLVKSFLTKLLVCYTNVINFSAILSPVTLKVGVVERFGH
jgi:hypothetical protein